MNEQKTDFNLLYKKQIAINLVLYSLIRSNMKTQLLLLNLVTFSIFSQNSLSSLDFNNVKAGFDQSGVLFNNPSTSSRLYQIPKNSNLNTIFSGSFWVGGKDQSGFLHLAAVKYGSGDYFSGPYSSTNSYNDSLYIQKYENKFWNVTQSQIQNHLANYLNPGYVPDSALLNWPGNGDVSLGVASNLAPFVDLNGDNIYNPYGGDYPDIRGESALFFILNDAKGIHTQSGGYTLNMEMHIMAYQYSGSNFLNNTTFLNVRIFNRGTLQLSDFKVGFFVDGDLGYFNDDYFGCKPSKNMMYFYNADNIDEPNGNANQYGQNPPACGIVSLSKPVGAIGCFSGTNGFPHSDPATNQPTQFWNYLNSKWADGSPWLQGGLGWENSAGATNVPYDYMFDGNPTTSVGWSEMTNQNVAGDRRGLMVLESMNFNANQSDCMDFAILYGRSGNHLENVQTVINLADSVKLFYESQSLFNCNQVTLAVNSISDDEFTLYPNPSDGKVTIKSLTPFALSIYDINGRFISNPIQSKNINEFDLQLNKGVYFFHLETNKGKTIKKVIIN